MKMIYRILDFLKHPFLLLIRLYWGYAFFQAGFGKFNNMPHVIDFFTQLGIFMPKYNAYFVATVETVGGLFLMAGLFSRLIAIPLVINMIVALLTAHAAATLNLLHDPKTFFEQEPFLFLYASLIVTLFGPGAFSIDDLRYRLKERVSK